MNEKCHKNYINLIKAKEDFTDLQHVVKNQIEFIYFQ